jgi:hypothetical protein
LFAFVSPNNDTLTYVLRTGARKLLALAIELESAAFLAEMKDHKLTDGRDRIVRHGHAPERSAVGGIGATLLPTLRPHGALIGRNHLLYGIFVFPSSQNRRVDVRPSVPEPFLLIPGKREIGALGRSLQRIFFFEGHCQVGSPGRIGVPRDKQGEKERQSR